LGKTVLPLRDNGGADLYAPQPPSFVFCLSFNNDMFFAGCLNTRE
jgi:hypothetical protein